MAGGRRGFRRARRLHRLALAARARGWTAEARRYVERARGLLDPAHPEHRELLVRALVLLAELDHDAAAFGEAERAYRKACSILPAEASGETACAALVGWGNALRILARYAEAAHVLDRARAAADDPAVGPRTRAAVHGALGVLHRYTGRFEEARGQYEEALSLLDPDAVDAATVLHNLAGLGHAQGHYAAAETPARRAVKIRERCAGSDHPDVAADASVLGAVLTGLGRYAEAEATVSRALAIWERHVGPDHYEIAVNLNNLAAVYQATGRGGEAAAMYRRALEIKTRVLGPEHPELEGLRRNLASVPVQAPPALHAAPGDCGAPDTWSRADSASIRGPSNQEHRSGGRPRNRSDLRC